MRFVDSRLGIVGDFNHDSAFRINQLTVAVNLTAGRVNLHLKLNELGNRLDVFGVQ